MENTFYPFLLKKDCIPFLNLLKNDSLQILKTILAVFWIALYVFVNLASVLYLGSLALETIMGIPMIYGVIGLALFAAAYSLYGGLSAVAWTDVIQVIFLVLGGLVTTYLALNTVSGGEGVIAGIKTVYEAAPDRFAMILDKSNPEYKNLPGIGVLVGGIVGCKFILLGIQSIYYSKNFGSKIFKRITKRYFIGSIFKISNSINCCYSRYCSLCND